MMMMVKYSVMMMEHKKRKKIRLTVKYSEFWPRVHQTRYNLHSLTKQKILYYTNIYTYIQIILCALWYFEVINFFFNSTNTLPIIYAILYETKFLNFYHFLIELTRKCENSADLSSNWLAWGGRIRNWFYFSR